jgi:hypothetical protein
LPDCEVGRGCSWCGCRRVGSWGWPRKLSDFCVQVQIESFGLQLPRSLLHYSETGLAARRRWELGLCQAASCCSWLENWQITWPVGLAHRPSATLHHTLEFSCCFSQFYQQDRTSPPSNFPCLEHRRKFSSTTASGRNITMAPLSYSKTAKVPRRPFEAARLLVHLFSR